MNRREAQELVYRFTAAALREMTTRRDAGKKIGGGNLTPSQLSKVKQEMTKLADKLEAKFPQKEPIDAAAS